MNTKSTSEGTSEDSLTKDELLLKRSLQSHLDAKVDNLDYTVTSKLSAARHRAMSAKSESRYKTNTSDAWFSWTTVAGSTAVLAIAAVLGLQMFSSQTMQPADSFDQTAQHVLMEDLNLLSSSDDIEFYQSVDFLEWMENNSG